MPAPRLLLLPCLGGLDCCIKFLQGLIQSIGGPFVFVQRVSRCINCLFHCLVCFFVGVCCSHLLHLLSDLITPVLIPSLLVLCSKLSTEALTATLFLWLLILDTDRALIYIGKQTVSLGLLKRCPLSGVNEHPAANQNQFFHIDHGVMCSITYSKLSVMFTVGGVHL